MMLGFELKYFLKFIGGLTLCCLFLILGYPTQSLNGAVFSKYKQLYSESIPEITKPIGEDLTLFLAEMCELAYASSDVVQRELKSAFFDEALTYEEGETFAYLAFSREHKLAFVVFRGENVEAMSGWKSGLAPLSKRANEKSQVSLNFYMMMKNLLDNGIANDLQYYCRGYRVIATGHSSGGAAALLSSLSVPVEVVVTFSQPPVGRHLEQYVKADYLRVTTAGDTIKNFNTRGVNNWNHFGREYALPKGNSGIRDYVSGIGLSGDPVMQRLLRECQALVQRKDLSADEIIKNGINPRLSQAEERAKTLIVALVVTPAYVQEAPAILKQIRDMVGVLYGQRIEQILADCKYWIRQTGSSPEKIITKEVLPRYGQAQAILAQIHDPVVIQRAKQSLEGIQKTVEPFYIDKMEAILSDCDYWVKQPGLSYERIHEHIEPRLEKIDEIFKQFPALLESQRGRQVGYLIENLHGLIDPYFLQKMEEVYQACNHWVGQTRFSRAQIWRDQLNPRYTRLKHLAGNIQRPEQSNRANAILQAVEGFK